MNYPLPWNYTLQISRCCTSRSCNTENNTATNPFKKLTYKNGGTFANTADQERD